MLKDDASVSINHMKEVVKWKCIAQPRRLQKSFHPYLSYLELYLYYITEVEKAFV